MVAPASDTDVPALDLRAGEWVEVRSEEEILSTLDEGGTLDGLPFMPEMRRYCGRRFSVYKRADKTCDTAMWTGLRRMHDVVHLNMLRCTGEAHGGCQAGCLTFWKEAWLRRVDPTAPVVAPFHDAPPDASPLASVAEAHAVRDTGPPVAYRCQATELVAATDGAIPWWDLRHLARDVRTRNITTREALWAALYLFVNKFQGATRRIGYPVIRGGARYPFLRGQLDRTPRERLDLQPGDLVQIKSRAEIEATLDRNNRNRGLSFDGEMVRYCGRQARVKARVDRILDERTGEVVTFSTDCVILDGVYCRSDFHQMCPRAIYSYWREIWLRPVESA